MNIKLLKVCISDVKDLYSFVVVVVDARSIALSMLFKFVVSGKKKKNCPLMALISSSKTLYNNIFYSDRRFSLYVVLLHAA